MRNSGEPAPAALAGPFRRALGYTVRFGIAGLLTLLAGRASAAQAPIIDSLTADRPVVAPGDVIRITVTAHDPDCVGDCLTGCGLTISPGLTLWTFSDGNVSARDDGVQASPYQAWLDWQAPQQEGIQTLQVSVSDSGTFMCGGRQTTTDVLSLNVTTSTNQPPVVDSLVADPVRVFPGESSQLTCSATDPDPGDSLSFSWTADQGVVTPNGLGLALVTNDRPGAANVTCVVTDTEGAVASDAVAVAFSDAFAESELSDGLAAPGRIAVDSLGDVYVADGASGGLAVVNLSSGKFAYHLPLPGVSCVAVDWQDRLLVGSPRGARVIDRWGQTVLILDPGESLGAVAAVATDPPRLRYAVLHQAGRVIVYDAAGTRTAALGSPGDGPEQLKGPRGLAITPGGHFVVADSGHGQIKVFAVDGTLQAAFGSSGGGAGQFIQLEDVAVDERGVIFATDAYQSWVQSFDPDGRLREVLGSYGEGAGGFRTPTGLAVADASRRLIVASENSSSLHVFRLDGAPPLLRLPRPVLSDSQLDFTAQPVGTLTPPKAVTLTNEGDAPLGIRDTSLLGRFEESNDCSAFLDPGQGCTLSMRYLPEFPGSDSGSLTIETSATSALQVVHLTGQAIVPADLIVVPSELNFGDEAVGSTSPAASLMLTSTGSVPLQFLSASATGPFSVVSICPSVLEGGSSCGLDIYFSPDVPGDSLPGTLTIVSDAASGVRSVPLDGRGVLLALTPSTAAIDFGYGRVGSSSKPHVIALTNAGEDFLIVEQITLEGSGQDGFALVNDACSGVRLETSQACQLDVVFAPPDQDTRYAADVRVWSRAAGSPDTVALSGTTVLADLPIFADDFETGDLSLWTTSHPPKLELPSSVATSEQPSRALEVRFGRQAIAGSAATERVPILNVGPVPLQLGSIVLDVAEAGAFSVAADSCQALLGPGERCELLVTFAPSVQGLARATIVIRYAERTARIALVGFGEASVPKKGDVPDR